MCKQSDSKDRDNSFQLEVPLSAQILKLDNHRLANAVNIVLKFASKLYFVVVKNTQKESCKTNCKNYNFIIIFIKVNKQFSQYDNCRSVFNICFRHTFGNKCEKVSRGE